MPPGERIGEHRDSGILAMIHRVHVPIDTNAQVTFTIGGSDHRLDVGTVYELNNVVRHSVSNDVATTRVHLLVDLLPHALGRAVYHDSDAAMAIACLRR